MPWLCRLVWEGETLGLPHTCPAAPLPSPWLGWRAMTAHISCQIFLELKELLLPCKHLIEIGGEEESPPTCLKSIFFLCPPSCRHVPHDGTEMWQACVGGTLQTHFLCAVSPSMQVWSGNSLNYHDVLRAARSAAQTEYVNTDSEC